MNKDFEINIITALEYISNILGKYRTRIRDIDILTKTVESLSENVQELSRVLKEYYEDTQDLLDRKTNKNRKKHPYNEKDLYTQCVRILDTVFSNVEGIFPYYSYLYSDITEFDYKGYPKNGVIVFSVVLDDFFKNKKYHCEVPIYILDGYIYDPLFFKYNNKMYDFSEKGVLDLVGKDRTPTLEQDLPSFAEGSSWANQHKNQSTMFSKTHLPFEKEEKVYGTFKKNLKVVEQAPQSWHVFNKPDMAPQMALNISAPPVYTSDFDYSLYP